MIVYHRGYKIEVKRERALGGWDNAYFSIFRVEDGLCVEDSFTEAEDPIRDIVKLLRKRVDELIETKGKSEHLEEEYEL